MVKKRTSSSLKLRRQQHREIRALTTRLLTVQDEERRKLSRDLHDDFCQRLAALGFEVTLLEAEPMPDAIRRQLQGFQTRLADLSGAVRNLAYQLHPSILEDLGLVPSLRALCEEISHRNGMGVAFRTKNVPGTLSREIKSCVYRVTQEALGNASKHSGAEHANVVLRGTKEGVVLTIQDNGIGFDPQSAKRKGGLGLISMKERVRLVNGQISIQSESGRGSKIIVTAPCPGTNS
ncbi:MAG: sensor histidine kinase [Bryobacteraceae bacterium]|jgi:signal transduction histidine kinase